MASEMTAPSRPIVYGEGETVQIGKHAIRMIPVNGVPWFALPDLIDAMGLDPKAADVVDGPDFPDHGKTLCNEEDDPSLPGSPSEVVMLSPVGVWTLTHLLGRHGYAKLAAQVRRFARERCPHPTPGDPAMFLTVRPDGMLPPVPSRYSGWNSEWLALRYAHPELTWVDRREAKAA